MATTNDIKNGSVLNIDGQLWTVIEFQHVKPGKGGAFVRTKMKNVIPGKLSTAPSTRERRSILRQSIAVSISICTRTATAMSSWI